MDTKDLGDKRINNEQQVNEGFSGQNLPEDYNPAAKKLSQEQETDKQDNMKTVDRARHTEEPPKKASYNSDANRGGDTEAEPNKTVENKDFMNSDTTANRYPKSHPDNHENRGNIKLDEE